MTTPNRPPSCDKLDKPELKPCPSCGAAAEMSSFNKSVFRCSDVNCFIYGPWGDSRGKKWNSIPRFSEVAELLRLVDASIIGTPTPAEERLLKYADKLRKEWKL